MSNPFQIPAPGLTGPGGVPLPAVPTKKPEVVSPRNYKPTKGTQTPAQYKASQKQGPPAPNGKPQTQMSLYDWQQMTGVYDAPPDMWNDAWTPTGFGVPGVPRALNQEGLGLIDARGQGIYGKDGRPSGVKPSSGGNASNRNDTRVIPGSGGQTQTGTNMGKVNMPGLEAADLTGIANFNGPSFPTQPGTNKITAGYSNTSSEQLQGISESERAQLRDAGFITAGDLDGFKPGGKFAGAPTATEGLGDNSAANAGNRANQAYGGSDGPGDAANKAYNSASMSDTLGDSSGLRFDASKYKGDMDKDGTGPMAYAQSGEEMRRRAAFLDEPDSMQAMRNVAAGMGMGYMGQQNFANVDGKAVAMSSADRRAILQAAPGEAQALKDKWVKALANNKSEEPQVPSSAQNPTTNSGTSTFVTDPKEDIAGVGESVDYSNNNADQLTNMRQADTFNAQNFENSKYKAAPVNPTKFYLK